MRDSTLRKVYNFVPDSCNQIRCIAMQNVYHKRLLAVVTTNMLRSPAQNFDNVCFMPVRPCLPRLASARGLRERTSLLIKSNDLVATCVNGFLCSVSYITLVICANNSYVCCALVPKYHLRLLGTSILVMMIRQQQARVTCITGCDAAE